VVGASEAVGLCRECLDQVGEAGWQEGRRAAEGEVGAVGAGGQVGGGERGDGGGPDAVEEDQGAGDTGGQGQTLVGEAAAQQMQMLIFVEEPGGDVGALPVDGELRGEPACGGPGEERRDVAGLAQVRRMAPRVWGRRPATVPRPAVARDGLRGCGVIPSRGTSSASIWLSPLKRG
jgi:hypothetical protein